MYVAHIALPVFALGWPLYVHIYRFHCMYTQYLRMYQHLIFIFGVLSRQVPSYAQYTHIHMCVHMYVHTYVTLLFNQIRSCVPMTCPLLSIDGSKLLVERFNSLRSHTRLIDGNCLKLNTPINQTRHLWLAYLLSHRKLKVEESMDC